MESRTELEKLIKSGNLQEFRAFWQSIDPQSRQSNLQLNSPDSSLRIALSAFNLEIIQFLLDEAQKMKLLDDLLKSQSGDSFPLLNHILSSDELMKSKSLITVVHKKIFKHVFDLMDKESQKIFFDQAVASGGLVDQLLKRNNMIGLDTLVTVESLDIEVGDLDDPDYDVTITDPFIEQKKIIRGKIDLVNKSAEILAKGNEPIKSQLNKLLSKTDTDMKVPNNIVYAIRSLNSHAQYLNRQEDTVSHDKSVAIRSMLTQLLSGPEKPAVEKIAEMKALVKKELDERDPHISKLLLNRSGGHGYESVSRIASFFKRPGFKYKDDQGKKYFANSGTEHRLIQLYEALDKWEKDINISKPSAGIKK